MNKLTCIILMVLFLTTACVESYGQYAYSDDLYYAKSVTFELGASLGMMNCLTDLGGKKGTGSKFVEGINFGDSKVNASVFVAVMYKYLVGLRLEVTFGNVAADDKVLAPVRETTYGRYERNLSFKSSIEEFSLIAELHPRYFKNYSEGEGANLPRFSPYLLGGVGFFSFNPQARLNGKWIDLEPLSTEGQGFKEYPDRKPYKLTQLLCPVGFGIKYKASPLINLSLECNSRILFTDYLDDVSRLYIDPAVYTNYFSGDQLNNALLLNDRQRELNPTHMNNVGFQRGNQENKDSYFTINFKIAALL